MKRILPTLASIFIAGNLAYAAPADIAIVYDASGSMWGQIDGTSKIEIARDVMADLISQWDDDSNLGLVAYGHRRKGDCTDIETLIEPGPLNKADFIKTVNSIMPVGKTPISASLQHAADLLSYRDSQVTIVLISDGLETCNADPCKTAKQLAEQGVKLTTHVIGFDLDTAAHANLSCIADNTGGIFVPASNAAQLHDALAQVQSVIEQQPASPKPEPEAEEPTLPEIEISGPQQVTIGTYFEVSWSKVLDPLDWVRIVPAGAEEDARGNSQRTSSGTATQLTAPADVGLYELRYARKEDGKILATAPIEVIEAGVTVAGPEQVMTGAVFEATTNKVVHHYDNIAIVPVGTKQAPRNTSRRPDKNLAVQLTAPADAGLYELRYILHEGQKTIATAPIEVVEAEITVSGPEQVVTGAEFEATTNTIVHRFDSIAIVPANGKEATRANSSQSKIDRNPTVQLRAPAESGLYELQYILYEGKKTLATAPIEVVEAEVTVAGPEQVVTGAEFEATTNTIVHRFDSIAIVPVGAKEGIRANSSKIDKNSAAKITAPADAGLYELRYILYEGKKTLATAPIEVVEAQIDISAPSIVRAESDVDITWSSSIHPRDTINIVPVGADEATRKSSLHVHDKTAGRLTAPKETGLYEIRYVLREGNKTIGSIFLEVIAADASLDDGAELSVPAAAQAGELISVSWSSTNNDHDQRIALARSNQADFSWVTVQATEEEKSMQLTMPDEPGSYEVRFLDLTARKVLGRSMIEVQ